MLKFNENQVIADNTVVINGVKKYNLTDNQTKQLILILDKMINTAAVENTVSAPEVQKPVVLHEVPEKSEPAPIPGKKMYQADFITVTEVDGKVRVYLHCPVKGEKGEKVRYALKKGFKDAGAKWSGDFKAGEFHWTFQTKKQAQDYIKAEKARASQRAKA